MNRLLQTVGLIVMLCTFALGQLELRQEQGRNASLANSVAVASTIELPFAAGAQDQQPDTKSDTKHLSKKEKKELKKRRKEEEKQRKKEAKKQEKELREQQKRAAKQEGKEQKIELKKQTKEVAKAQKETDKRERKEQAKEIKKAEKQEAHAERANTASAQRYTIPVSYRAAPDVLRAQRDVSRSIYSQLPNSHVIVLVNNANQLVLRGSAPSPSLKRRLLGLAMSAAGGYGIVDQLASNAMGSAASGLTSAAIGGVSDLIHGSGSRQDNSGSYSGPQGPPPPNNAPGGYGPPPSYPSSNNNAANYGPPPDNGSNSYGPPSASNSNNYGTPLSNGAYASNSSESSDVGLMRGSNACVNVSNSHQLLLTGQAASRLDGERLHEFAQRIGGTNANIVDQLATRSNAANPADGGENIPETLFDANALGSLLSPGSVVCVNTDTNDALLLTGTVGSSAELASVERSLQPLQGNARLIDQLTTGTLSSSSQSSTSRTTTGATMNPSAPATITESEVEQALHSIPRLSNVDADVSTSAVRLAGSVDTPEDERMAMEIAQQYAPGRSVTNNLTVNRRQQAVQ